MLPIDFEEANFTFTKPKNMTDEECSDLRVFMGVDTENKPCIVSKWKLSKEDIEEINNGGYLYIQIAGHQMPPISAYTENPFAQQQELQ